MAACLAACASPPAVRYVAPDFGAKVPARVAVLPFDNQSVDLAGPDVLRRLVQAALAGRGYQAIGLAEVDEGLAKLGVREGGQLAGLEPAALAQAVGAEGLLYGTVEEFTFQNVGFATRRLVRLRLALRRGSDGERLWEDTGQGATGSVTLDKKRAGRVFVEGLVEREVENLFRSPLMFESRLAVNELFSRLPRR